MLLAVVIAIVSAVYMELFFWFKSLTLSFRVATYLNKFGFCLWFYFAFIFKQDELRSFFKEKMKPNSLITNSEESKSNVIDMSSITEP